MRLVNGSNVHYHGAPARKGMKRACGSLALFPSLSLPPPLSFSPNPLPLSISPPSQSSAEDRPVQGYLVHKKHLPKGPTGKLFLMSEVPMYLRARLSSIAKLSRGSTGGYESGQTQVMRLVNGSNVHYLVMRLRYERA
jgi:hypothetical protein